MFEHNETLAQARERNIRDALREDIGLRDWRFTPGAGIRLQTPVGPIRVDLAYNPYGKTSGPLLLTDVEGGTLTRVRDDYRPSNNSLLSKLQLHLGIGQAY